jgi:cytochrome c oxidase subunit 6b
MSEEVTLSTAPTSKRFPTTNQAKACYMYYNSWHQCKYDYSDEEPQCAKLKSWAMGMCPFDWVRTPAPRSLPLAAHYSISRENECSLPGRALYCSHCGKRPAVGVARAWTALAAMPLALCLRLACQGRET